MPLLALAAFTALIKEDVIFFEDGHSILLIVIILEIILLFKFRRLKAIIEEFINKNISSLLLIFLDLWNFSLCFMNTDRIFQTRWFFEWKLISFLSTNDIFCSLIIPISIITNINNSIIIIVLQALLLYNLKFKTIFRLAIN